VRGATAQPRVPRPAGGGAGATVKLLTDFPGYEYAVLCYEKGLNARVPSAETLMKQYCLNGTCGT
jgi:hypothetical protein